MLYSQENQITGTHMLQLTLHRAPFQQADIQHIQI
ncbi:MAG: hypothetical protein BWY71_02377 [Planctomycetes bacterium ADurb.Bin412]|nr:MAG: hypothetical protein BWY71_02377 [Planctomycetes bacterium ADurb.Bin412]